MIDDSSHSKSPHPRVIDKLRSMWADTADWFEGFFYGMTYYEMYKTLQRERADREYLFVLISFGDLIGLPILPPYYSMRLLPYIVPLTQTWKRHLLRERDLTDLIDG